MKTIFETVIDGVVYEFTTKEWYYPYHEWICYTCYEGRCLEINSNISEEDAILKLVKILEK